MDEWHESTGVRKQSRRGSLEQHTSLLKCTSYSSFLLLWIKAKVENGSNLPGQRAFEPRPGWSWRGGSSLCLGWRERCSSCTCCRSLAWWTCRHMRRTQSQHQRRQNAVEGKKNSAATFSHKSAVCVRSMVDRHDVSVGLLQRQQHVARLLTAVCDGQQARKVPVGVRTGQNIHQFLPLQNLRLQPLGHAAWTNTATHITVEVLLQESNMQRLAKTYLISQFSLVCGSWSVSSS